MEAIGQEIKNLKVPDPKVLKEIVVKHTKDLLAAALGLGFSSSDAEELTQEVFVSFLNAAERFEGRSKLKTYLFGILYNKAHEMWRKQRKEETVENIEEIYDQHFDAQGMWQTPPHGPEEELLTKELAGWIEQCSERLSLDQRTAFYLKEVDGENPKNICNILNVSITHLGVLLFRARNKLRECLEKRMKRS